MADLINRIQLTIKYLWGNWRSFYAKETIIGAYCSLRWNSSEYSQHFYISFSPEARIYEGDEYEMDNYGILDDDIFYYSGRKEFLKRFWVQHPIDTWRIVGFVLNTTQVLQD